MTPWDKGKSAARNGLSRKSNPFDNPDRHPAGDSWERKASEWDEGFDCFNAEAEAKMRTERAKKAAMTRWEKIIETPAKRNNES